MAAGASGQGHGAGAGFGSCGIYMPGKKFHGYIDAHAPAPLGARPDMWANLIESEARDGYGFILKGSLKRVGDRVVNRDYAQTLRAIAKGGADVFYSGELARAIAEDMKKNEALLSIDDLLAWKPVRNPPLWGDYRGYAVSTNQPPGGGVMLLEMLNILENFDR